MSLAEAELTTKLASDLNPSLTSSWWTAPRPSRALIGSCPSSGSCSSKWIIDAPDLTAFTTSDFKFVIAFLRLIDLSKDKVNSLTLKYLFFRIVASFLCESKGDEVINLFACWGVSSYTFNSGPKHVSNDITLFSLRESIGGFVTWANCCLKKSYTCLCIFDITANAVSSPIDPVPSWESIARGFITELRSSLKSKNSFEAVVNLLWDIFFKPGPPKSLRDDSI